MQGNQAGGLALSSGECIIWAGMGDPSRSFSIPVLYIIAANNNSSMTIRRIYVLYNPAKQISTLKFCRVCGFRGSVWGSYRTSRSFGYGYGSVTELPEVPGIVAQAYSTHRSSGRVQNTMYPYPGHCGTGLENTQKFRVRV